MPQIGVRQDRLGAVLGDDPGPAALDLAERLVPRDAFELPAAFGPAAPHRIQDPARVVVVLGEILELDAKSAAGHRVVGIARHLDELAVLHVIEKGAGIGAILRAGALDNPCVADMHGHRGLLA